MGESSKMKRLAFWKYSIGGNYNYLLHVSGVQGTWEGLGDASRAPSLVTLTPPLSILLLHSVFEISLSHCPPSPSPSWVVLSLFSSYRLHDRSASTWNNKALNVVFIPSAAHQRVICTLLPCFHVIRQISKEKFRNWVSDHVRNTSYNSMAFI